MSDRPTPETDHSPIPQIADGAKYVSRDFARRLERQRDAAVEALKEYLDAGQNCVTTDDDVSAMLRFGKAEEQARAILRKIEGES